MGNDSSRIHLKSFCKVEVSILNFIQDYPGYLRLQNIDLKDCICISFLQRFYILLVSALLYMTLRLFLGTNVFIRRRNKSAFFNVDFYEGLLPQHDNYLKNIYLIYIDILFFAMRGLYEYRFYFKNQLRGWCFYKS